MKRMKRMKGSRAFMALFLAVVMVLGNALAGTYYIEDGSIEIHASETSQTVTQADNTQNDNAPVISNKNPETPSANTVTIISDKGCTASVTVKDLNIDVSAKDSTPAVKTEGAGDVNIELDGDSSLKSGAGSAGLQKENTGNLTINDTDQNGKLEATGGTKAAGIGGGEGDSGLTIKNITITGGEVTATGGDGGAGIGGGYNQDASNITITGGKVTAIGGSSGAGIGGGDWGGGVYIEITGDAEVTATGGDRGAGIGGGRHGDGRYIKITGGEVTAIGGEQAAGIGGAASTYVTDITISGGKVTATGGEAGAGIGGGLGSHGWDIEIRNSAQVSAAGGASVFPHGAAAIGDGAAAGDVDGKTIDPKTDALTCGSIEYYAPGTSVEDIQNDTVSPEKTVQGNKAHTPSSDWTGDSKTHWHSCTEPGCVVRIDEAAHTPVTDPETPPTCTDTGLTSGSHCSGCGRILTKQNIIPATDHEWDTGWTSDGKTHWHKCLHKGCDARKDETGHTPVTDKGKAATCTEAGLTDGSHCSVCGYILTKQETIPANHTWNTEWSTDGTKHWHKCTADGCTAIQDEGEHTAGKPVKENEKPAQVGKAGSYDIVVCCSVCGWEMSRETVTTDPLPEKEDKKMPQGNLAALCAEMAKQIRQAPENGTVEMDAGSFDGLTRVVFKALGERPDVTLKLQTKEGLITIPAGAGLLEKIGKKNTVSFAELKDMLK